MTHAHAPGPCCTTVQLPFEPLSARTARHMVCLDLDKAGIRQTVIDDAALVMSEIVANGVLHGDPGVRNEIEVSWCLSEEFLRLSVLDGGTAVQLRPLELTDYAVHGRGLAIVDYLCANWTVNREDGTRVTAELALT